MYFFNVYLINISLGCDEGSSHPYSSSSSAAAAAAWISLTLSRYPPYCPLLPAGLQEYIPYRHRAAESRFELPLLLKVGSSYLCSAMWGGPQEYIPFKLVSTYTVVSRMSGSSNLDSFRDGWYVAVQQLLCGLLLPGFVQYSSRHSCVVAVKLFHHTLS